MKNQDQQALDEFKAHIMSPEGKQSLSESLDEWFTMGEICEQVNEEYPDSTDEEFINECLKRYDIIFPMNDDSRNLWIDTLKDMLIKCS